MADASWSLLDPGADPIAEAIRDLFPVGSGASANLGGASTVLSSMLGTISAVACAVLVAFVAYNALTKTVHWSERGTAQESQSSWWALLRLALAALLLFPLPGGYCAGQALIVNVAISGLGLATNLAKAAVGQIGAGTQTIVTPLIPSTKRTVSALMENELCRALVNAASGNANLVPEPTPITGTNADGYGYVTWSYDLSGGNVTGSPVCGSLTVRVQSGATVSAGSVDVASLQKDAVNAVLTSSIRPMATTTAQAMWQSRQASSLTGMMAGLTSASALYTSKLQTAATQATSQLRDQFSSDAMRQGNMTNGGGVAAMSDAGFFGLGAYYMSFSRLNGFTLSLMGAMPQVTAPSYQGLGIYLSQDLAPMMAAVLEFQHRLDSYVTTVDPRDAPSGGGDVFSGTAPVAQGAGILETVLRQMDFSESLLLLFVNNLAPAQSNWADPFSALMRLGNDMASLALTALGTSALLSSGAVTAGITTFNLLTLNFTGAAATVASNVLVNFLATPIFYLLMALLIPGLILAFIVPMIPLVMWVLGILGWLLLVFEGLIAVPLWMLAHATFAGDGLHGRGIRGWGNVVVIFLRPSLMVVGMFGAYWAFTFASRLIFLTFTVAAGFTLAQGWMVANLAGMLVLMSLFTLLHITVEVQCFRLITLVAVHVPTWLGIDSPERINEHQLAQEASMVGMAATLSSIRSGAISLSRPGKDDNDGARNQGRLGRASAMLGVDPAVAAATDPGPVSAKA